VPLVRRLILTTSLVFWFTLQASAQLRLADDSDRAAFRSWFVLLADAQFERPTADVTDCAALVRHAFREALRSHTPEWVRRAGLPFAPQFADVRSAPRADADGWPLFRVSEHSTPAYAEFADAQTIVRLNSRPLGRNLTAARPGDLIYFRQSGQTQPDHLMVFVGRSFFEEQGDDWVVYHTGPSDEGPGEVRKLRLSTLLAHPAPRWRPVASNPNFVGLFRLAPL
jgi:uncharacterized protein YfaT (DUF1175 family)